MRVSQLSQTRPVATVTTSFSGFESSSSFFWPSLVDLSNFSATLFTSPISEDSSFKAVFVRIWISAWKAFVYSFGVTSKAPVTSDGSTDSFNAERTVQTAEGVNGGVIVRRESLVTCDFNALDEAVKSGSASLPVTSLDAGF